ncbi:hypothetical protein PG984_016624 [Apiospora sp. TS-2023a]
MDPFAAMGAASAIITFLDFGATIVKTAKEIHASASGASKNNEDLEDLTKKMEEISLDLKPSKSPPDLSISEKAFLEVCEECRSLSTELLNVLNDVKSKTPSSKRSSLTATIRNIRPKNTNKLKELESKLERCTKMFQVQLMRLTRRDELGQRLDEIVKTGKITESELQSLRKNTDSLHTGITVKLLEPNALKQLQLLLGRSEEAIEKAGQTLILEQLRDPSMDVRFFDIPEAHSQTLSWIFDGLDEAIVDPETDHNYYISTSTDPTKVAKWTFDAMGEAREDYLSWLKESPLKAEEAIFHISGKPGAGKSTLMKYLRTHEATFDVLRDWAGPKKLVLCHYFAWRPGSAIQNTIRGLLITLLYSILRDAPELSHLAFKQKWQKVTADHFLDISPAEIQRGLDAILKNSIAYDTHRFCIFIDGLDEFYEDPEDVIGLIREWTTFAGSNLKLCVSSREWLVFQHRFRLCPKLKLQDINRRDIALRVKDGLESIEEFETREEKSEILALEYDLTEKSEGVFLWVKLALNSVRESVMSRESAADIARKINELPRELEDAFQYIFDSMKNHQLHSERRRAMLTLRFVIDYPNFLRHKLQGGFPLLRYSFLDEYDNNHHFAQKGRPNQWSAFELVSRLDRAHKQVVRRCFGLVEVTESIYDQSKALGFVHRAVSEFMHRDHISRDMYALTADFDMAGFTCQCFLATTKFISPPTDYYDAHNANNLNDLNDLDCKTPTIEAFIHDLVFTAVSSSQSGYEVSFGTPQYVPDDHSRRCGIAHAVLLVVCSSGLFELVRPTLLLSQQRTQETSLPESKSSIINLELLLWFTLPSLQGNASEQCTFNILDFLLLTWCPDTADLVNDTMWEPTHWPGLWRGLVWSGFWRAHSYMYGYDTPLEPILRIFLLYGATPDLSFRITRYLRDKRCYWMVNSLEPQDTCTSCFGKGEVEFDHQPRSWPTPEYEGMNHVIIRRGLLFEILETYLLNSHQAEYTFSLHQLVELWFPLHRAKSLQYLIEQTMLRGRPPCREEVLALKANKDLDVDIQNGITFEQPVFRDRRHDIPDLDWKSWLDDGGYCADSATESDWETIGDSEDDNE